jgi:monothiol glutaredoxin
MLFMKGTPDQPRCGFSMRTAAALNALGVQYAAMDILPDPRIREELSGLSGWPTIPQLFVDGKLVGGCDIVMEMYESGELAETLGVQQPAEEREQSQAEAPESAPLGIENRLN